MKNIHVLPTAKTSKLIFDAIEDKLCLKTEKSKIIGLHQNIYITSDGKIKAGDFCINIDNEVVQVNQSTSIFYRSKIILTTDIDLIKDGVQEIDDEFLEWFVKNPSCEFVKVEKGCILYDFKYKIIIPKEEPKQETLEEAAKKYSLKYKGEFASADFTNGAKWQEQNSDKKWSDEDMLAFVQKYSVNKLSKSHLEYFNNLPKFKKK